jgi:IrrE N-terminal-like domain
MDEFRAVLKARELVRKANPTMIPASLETYAAEMGAVIRLQDDLDPTEPGWSFPSNGKHYICVNAKDKPERRRFTICHEVAHIALGLASDHRRSPWSSSYLRKSPDEVLCDVFAAELLLPHQLFKPLADRATIGFAAIDVLAGDFAASVTATGSRFATVLNAPCAFVLSEQGKVRYTSRSTMLREAYAWITPQSNVPRNSLSARIRAGETCDEADEVDADLWFHDWQRGGTLLEEGRHLSQWDQTLTLLWFEDEEVPAARDRADRDEADHDERLRELDGTLPWPDKKRRK